MGGDRHRVADSELSAALDAVPGALSREVKLAQYGGVTGIDVIGSMVRDYVAARTVAADPDCGSPQTWLALRTVADLAVDRVAARLLPAGEHVDVDVRLLGVGFGCTVGEERRVTAEQ